MAGCGRFCFSFGGVFVYWIDHPGAVAQLGERYVRNVEVRSSTLLSSSKETSGNRRLFFYARVLPTVQRLASFE
jgi:hypothetical protein